MFLNSLSHCPNDNKVKVFSITKDPINLSRIIKKLTSTSKINVHAHSFQEVVKIQKGRQLSI